MSDVTLVPGYQPIIELGSGRVAGHEVLARRLGKSGDLLPALEWIAGAALAPEDRLGNDRTVRRQALEWLAGDSGDGGFLTLNISPEWIDNLPSLDIVPTLKMIGDLGVDPGRVVIEITELGGDLDRIARLSERYRAEGLRIAFDDFGAGFQQLDRLLSFTPDIIKLDLQMFQRSSGRAATTLMQMIGEMSSQLGCEIICEKVENATDLALAIESKASFIQGFLFAPAQPTPVATDSYREQVETLLGEYRQRRGEQLRNRELVSKRMRKLVRDLSGLIEANELQSVHASSMDRRLARCYVCDRNGRQVSPNYERTLQGIWHANDLKRGYNWSWRPYFYELFHDLPAPGTLRESSRYLDLVSGRRCFTIALVTGAESILLVDVLD